jgi:hypothetical protein
MTTTSEARAGREWLLANYLVPDREAEAFLDCVEAQGGFDYLDAQAERYAGMAWEPGPAAVDEGYAFALTALVECHEGPHLATCPDAG